MNEGSPITTPIRAFTEATVPERQHHAYSPSSLQMREACACYQNRSGSNEAAIAGTLQHEVVETGHDNSKLSDEQILAAADCADFSDRIKLLMLEERERARLEIARSQPVGFESHPIELPEVLDLVEEYLPIDDCDFVDTILIERTGGDGHTRKHAEKRHTKSTTAGYVDRALVNWDRTRAVLIDYKFGQWHVEKADNNLQAISYVLGIFFMFKTVNTVEFFFKLPHLDTVSKATFTRGQLPELYLRVQTVVARAREADARILQSDDWSMATPKIPACNFCNRIGSCPKVAAIALKVGHKFFPAEIPGDIDPTGLKSDSDAAFGIRLSQVLAIWAKSFRAQVSDRVIRGEAPMPPGYKVQSRADREVVDTAKLKNITLKYLTTAELEVLAHYTFGDIEESISAKAPRGSKKATIEEYQAALITDGAVKRGQPYSFLKAYSEKSE